MKFSLISHVLPPSWSGQAVMIYRILRGIDPHTYVLISKQNYIKQDISSYTNRLDGKYYHISAGISQKIFGRIPFLKKPSIYFDILCRGLAISRIVLSEHCDSIIACSGDLIDLPAANLASQLTGAKLIPYYFDDYVNQWPSDFSRCLAQKFENKFSKRAVVVIVPNEFLQDALQKHRFASASIVRNSADTITTKVEIRPLPTSGEIKIIYSGAIYHVNASTFRNLIAAINLVRIPDLRFHIYTAQPLKLLIKEGIFGNQVVYHEHASSNEIASAQKAAHIVFIPFSFNSIVSEVIRTSAPGKMADYLASGVPILANVPSDSYVAWYLNKYRCGVVVDNDQPKPLADAIKLLIENDDLRSALSHAALKQAKADFDPEKNQIKFLDILGGI